MLSNLTHRTVLAAVLTLTWSMDAGAAAPTISGTPDTKTTTNYAYRFQPTARDADGQRLKFSISNKPRWATFSSSTGVLSGKPTSAGTYSNIVIRASDGRNTASLPAFRITVIANKAPTISGTPVRTATTGSPYAFRPSASDADGEPRPLSFVIANKPAWATFDTTTGTLHGTPTAAGTHGGVVISVTDGQATTGLPAFDIAVQGGGGGSYSTTVRWTPPTRNTDGTPITGLAGYRVDYGVSPGSYTTSLNVPGAATTAVVIEGLRSGRYYFAVRSVNSAGTVSDYSNEATRLF